MSGANRGGISIKTKIFAVLAVAVIMAAAFVGVASIKGSDDSDATTLTINEASGTVNYVPNEINVGVGKTVTFSPYTNWATGLAYPGYTVSVTITAEESSDYFSTTTTTPVTVTGDAVGNGTLTLTAVANIYKDAILVNSVSTTATVAVNVYEALDNVEDIISENCYLGTAVDVDLTSNVIGSGTYAISVNGALPQGLYVLGNKLAGFITKDAVGGSYPVTVVDTLTGEMKTYTLTLAVFEYSIDCKVYTSDSNDVVVNDTAYISQGTFSKAEVTIGNCTNASFSTVIIDGTSQALGTGYTVSGKTLTINTTGFSGIVVGTHTVVVNYTVDGNVGTYVFYLAVLSDGTYFIIPDPSITITVTA